MIHELAPAKVNLVLQVGRRRPDGLHPICSLFASLVLADEVELAPSEEGGADIVECPGVAGINLAATALAVFRERAAGAGADLPPLRLTITKHIPVAAGLGGGSADAAATLRAANRLAGGPLDREALLELAAGLGSDVPSQVEPRSAIVQGTGQLIEPVSLPAFTVVLVPHREGLAAAAAYEELDRLGGGRERLEPDRVRSLLGGTPDLLAGGLENDLEGAVLSLRPELKETLAALRSAGAPAAAVSGSGPTCFALFPDPPTAEQAARAIPGSLVTHLQS